MSYFIKYSIYTLFIVTLFSSCEQEGDPLEITDLYDTAVVFKQQPFVKARIDVFRFNGVNNTIQFPDGKFQLVSYGERGESIVLTSSFPALGYYNYSNDKGIDITTYDPANGEIHISNSDLLTNNTELFITEIDSLNRTMSGLFSGTLYLLDSPNHRDKRAQKLIQSGEFNKISF